MGKSRPNRRSKLLINEAMQRKIVLQTALLPIMVLTALSVVALIEGAPLMAAADVGTSYPNLKPLFIALLSFLAAAALLILYVALRFSHRVAGPTHRLMRFI